MRSKAELLQQILELEKRRSTLLAGEERPGPFQILVLALGVSGALVALALMGWVLVAPIRGHGSQFAASCGALVAVGLASAALIQAAKPRLSVREAEELAQVQAQIAAQQELLRDR